MTRRVLAVWIVVLFGVVSCVDQISFPLEKSRTGRLIVSGLFTDMNDTHIVFLSEAASQDRPPLPSGGYLTLDNKPRPVQNARVQLFSSPGNESWVYQEARPGEYELKGDFVTKDGLSYYLEIQIEDRIYRSRVQTMPEHIGADKLSFSFERTRLDDNPDAAMAVIRSQVTLPEVDGGYYLRWAVDEAYFWDLTFFPNPFNTPPPNCIVFGYPEPERITRINGDLLGKNPGKSTQIVAQRLVDQSFLSRHYFNVRQLSVSKETFDYWGKVSEVVNNTGSVFDTPPAPIRGNMYNVNNPDEVVLGYFEVAKARITRIYTTAADVPFFLEKECLYQLNKPIDQYLRSCLSCSFFPNSTTEYPEWWFDQ